jgi:transposase
MLTGANTRGLTVFEELVDAVEPIKRPGRGQPRKRPEKLHPDKAYDSKSCRGALSERGIKLRIARKGKESCQKLGRHRWVVERTLALLARCRRLAARYDRQANIHEAFLHLGCSLICLNYGIPAVLRPRRPLDAGGDVPSSTNPGVPTYGALANILMLR